MEAEKLTGLECKRNEVKIELEEEDFGNLIESLQHIGKALTRIQKQLGIKEVALPLLEESKM
jgi:hypothetical protein